MGCHPPTVSSFPPTPPIKTRTWHPFSHRAIKRHRPPELGETCRGEPAGTSAVNVLLPLVFLSTGKVALNPFSSTPTTAPSPAPAPTTAPAPAPAPAPTPTPMTAPAPTTSPKHVIDGEKKITLSTPKTAYRAAFTITTTTPLHPQPTKWLTTASHFSKTWDSSPKKGGNVTD